MITMHENVHLAISYQYNYHDLPALSGQFAISSNICKNNFLSRESHKDQSQNWGLSAHGSLGKNMTIVIHLLCCYIKTPMGIRP